MPRTYTLKTIGYAYRSSEIAQRLSMSETGCYYVALKVDEATPATLSTLAGGWDNLTDAARYADTLPQPYSHYSKRA